MLCLWSWGYLTWFFYSPEIRLSIVIEVLNDWSESLENIFRPVTLMCFGEHGVLQLVSDVNKFLVLVEELVHFWRCKGFFATLS